MTRQTTSVAEDLRFVSNRKKLHIGNLDGGDFECLVYAYVNKKPLIQRLEAFGFGCELILSHKISLAA
jgi:hypothetical protein